MIDKKGFLSLYKKIQNRVAISALFMTFFCIELVIFHICKRNFTTCFLVYAIVETFYFLIGMKILQENHSKIKIKLKIHIISFILITVFVIVFKLWSKYVIYPSSGIIFSTIIWILIFVFMIIALYISFIKVLNNEWLFLILLYILCFISILINFLLFQGNSASYFPQSFNMLILKTLLFYIYNLILIIIFGSYKKLSLQNKNMIV